MVDVSQKWQDNQDASVHVQGYVRVSLTDENGKVTLSSLDTNSHIKQTVHKRSFDPLGFELPRNGLTLELYNYDGIYTHYYKDYTGQPIKIEVKYGYVFGDGPEEIQGGIFEVDTISLGDDDTITFSAVSSMEKLDADTEVSVYLPPDTNGEYVTLYENTANNYDDVTDMVQLDTWEDFWEAHKPGPREVFAAIEDLTSLEVNIRADDFTAKTSFAMDRAVSIGAQELLKGAIFLSNKCVTINRYNQVDVADYKIFNTAVKLRNMLNRSTLKRSKQLKEMRINVAEVNLVPDETAKRDFIFSFISTGTDKYGNATYEADWAVDKIIYGVQYHGTTQKPTSSRTVYGIDLKVQDGEYIYRIKMRYPQDGFSQMSCDYVEINAESSKSTSVIPNIPYGEVCDINNPFDTSENFVALYFSNRSVYEVSLRGDPSRDTGDIVFLETSKGNFEKALILESELTFDGVFTENILARIIETDFADFVTDETDGKYFTVTDGVLTAFDCTQAQADGLTEITVPMSVTKIADEVFYGCDTLTKVNFYPTLKEIGARAFCACESLTEMRIPDSVTALGEEMLQMGDENNVMRTLVLPSYLTEIPLFFAECAAIKELYIPDSVTGIGGGALSQAFALKKVHLSSNLQEMGNSVFLSQALEEVVVPAGVKTIEESAFSNNKNLKKVFLSPGTETIKAYAFDSCLNGMEIFIPPTVTAIHDDAFGARSGEIQPKIYGYAGSEAEAYAKRKGYTFIEVKQ